MKKLGLLVLLTMFLGIFSAQVISLDIDAGQAKSKFETGNDVLEFMHQKYSKSPCKSYTFSQKNIHYKNDSVTGTSVWHEYIEFPDKFRIDFGDRIEGNFVIFRNDSSFNYRKHELKKARTDSNTLLLLLGGMYYRELSDVKARLLKENYNLNVLSVQKHKKQTFYVIGATAGDSTSNQIWVSKKNWRIERIIEKMSENTYMDMSFDAFKKNCNGYIETKVTFKRNAKTEQVEEYYNIEQADKLPNEVFYPEKK